MYNTLVSLSLIIIHVRRYGESSRGPYHPWGRAHAPARVCVPARPHTLACLGRQEDREDSRHTEQDRRHAGSSSPALPHAACLKCLPRLPALPCPSAPTAYPRLPAFHLARMCHIVNESATRAPRKTAFCQAILLFLDLSKRYILIHNDLRDN